MTDLTAYPPEPWYLGGTMEVSAFRVLLADVPPAVLSQIPPGRPVVRGATHAIVGVAFARYAPGGVLHYNELLVATPTVGRAGLRFSIPQIWVDSAASMTGGRVLWGIPKELGQFDRRVSGDLVNVEMTAEDRPVAAVRARYGRRVLPGMRQVSLPIEQRVSGGTVLSHNRVIGKITTLRTVWTFDPLGPLGYLAGRSPFASFGLRDASIVFGMDVRR
jgi:hypothetical protein